MALIGASFPQLIDNYKGTDTGTVINILKTQRPELDDAIATECNLGTIHRHTILTGIPSTGWGMLYKGVEQSKATHQQVDDTTGWVNTMSHVDTRLLKLASDPARLRLVSSAPYLESMGQEVARAIFYYDTASSPEKIKGLSPRYSRYYAGTYAARPLNSASQVVHGGGTGSDNTSIWFVTWGDHATTLLYPKGTKAGIDIQDKGEQRVLDGAGNPYFAKETVFEWHTGVAVKDWRYNVRIANIDVTDAMAGTVDLWALLRKGYYRLQSTRMDSENSRIAIYMNRDMLEILDTQSTNRALTTARDNTTGLGQSNVEGKMVTTYRGIPVRETDAILSTESAVVQYT